MANKSPADTMPRVLIIIPAFNESGSIHHVVDSLRSINRGWDILIVNDGSTDSTDVIARRLANIRVLRHCVNLGIGAAMQSGFLYAVRNGYDYALQFDGDGQHEAAAVPILFESLTGPAAPDVVIGSRFLDGGDTDSFKSTMARRMGIRLLGFAIRVLTGRAVADVTSGFRGYNRKALLLLARRYPTDFPEPEALILFSKAGLQVREVPVSMNPRFAGESSIAGLKTVYYIVKVLVALVIYALRPANKYTVDNDNCRQDAVCMR